MRSLQLTSRHVAAVALGLSLGGWVGIAIERPDDPGPMLWGAGLLTLVGTSIAAVHYLVQRLMWIKIPIPKHQLCSHALMRSFSQWYVTRYFSAIASAYASPSAGRRSNL